MANRRHGYGGRSYYNDGPVNPWQAGNVPGHNQGGYNPVGSNLMSQISEPLPQLAVAITKLLQQSQQVPSLMSMDTVNPMRSSGGYRPNNDYGPRGRMEMHRRARHDMRFGSKMGGRSARDTDFNRRRDTSNKLNERKVQAHRTAALAKRNKASSAKTTPKTAGKGSGGKSKEPENADGTSAADDTTNENDTKREEGDVKEEKGEGDEDANAAQSSEGAEDGAGADGDQENADTTIDDDEQAADGEQKKDGGEQGENQTNDKPKKKQGKTSLYDGIPRHLLRCRICMKKMWDGESFEKHMNGRTHQQMFEKVEESYRLKADMMRESIRLAEEKNSIEMMRMKRLGKKMKAQKVSRCAMCDLQFEGQLFMHRKSAGHQKLKHFLHPQCTYCNKEFPTRMEWENHRHTPEHFRKKAECTDRSDKHHDEDIHVEEDDFIDITFDDKDESEDANCLLDVPSDPYDIKSRIPSYNSKRAVGLSLIEETTGYYCKPCSRFFLSKATMEYHARTQLHYKSFVDILNEMQAECTGKHKIADEDDNEGNWKRRKVVKDDQDQDQDQDGEGATDESKQGTNEDGNALYDPADTFLSNDANDVCVIEDEEQKNNCTGKDVDEVWNEVDQKLDEILEEKKDGEDKQQEQQKDEEQQQQQEEEEEQQHEDDQQFQEDDIKQEPQEEVKQEVEPNIQQKQQPSPQQKPQPAAQTKSQQQQQKSPVQQQKPQQQKPSVQQQKPPVQQQKPQSGGAPQKPQQQHPTSSTPMKPGPMSKNVSNNAPPLAQRRTRGKRN